MARPSSYSEEIADRICSELAEGRSLRQICAADDLPHIGTVCRWVATNEAFREQYARAREGQAEAFADEIVAIADEADDSESAQVARVRIDARKWVASKLLPKKYGDKVQQEVTGADGGPIQAAITVEFVKPSQS